MELEKSGLSLRVPSRDFRDRPPACRSVFLAQRMRQKGVNSALAQSLSIPFSVSLFRHLLSVVHAHCRSMAGTIRHDEACEQESLGPPSGTYTVNMAEARSICPAVVILRSLERDTYLHEELNLISNSNWSRQKRYV